MTLRRALDTPEKVAFWAAVDRAAAACSADPSWRRAGIDICPRSFETWPSVEKETKANDRA